jgi:hypothetical protein
LIILTAISFQSLAGNILFPEGWESKNNRNPIEKGDNLVFYDGFENGIRNLKWKFKNGAKGEVKLSRQYSNSGKYSLEINKTNGDGYIDVFFSVPIKISPNKKYKASLFYYTKNSDPNYNLGMIRLVGKKYDLSYNRILDKGNGRNAMQNLINSSPDSWEKKIAGFQTSEKRITYHFVTAGNPVTVFIDDVCLYRQQKRKVSNPVPEEHSSDMISRKEFYNDLKKDIDHSAQLIKKDNKTTLLIDGKVVPPIVFKGYSGTSIKQNYFSGKRFDDAGINIQSIFVSVGPRKIKTYNNSKCKQEVIAGMWKGKGKYDVHDAVEIVEKSMRISPKSQFIITIAVNAYKEFGKDYPKEVWIDNHGKTVYGSYVHTPMPLKNSIPARYWAWYSVYSTEWLEGVKASLTEFIAALKSKGLSKRIIGFHLAGGHDWQNSTRHLDYSQPALQAFRKWLRKKYITEKNLKAAWKNSSVNFTNVKAPIIYDKKDEFFNPEEDQNKVDYFTFLKQGPYQVYEKIGKFIKDDFKKNILIVRWCMGALGGTYASAYDIENFLYSKVFDVLVSQPCYYMRRPGITSSCGLPLESFNLHGKLFLHEFDLRTYIRDIATEDEMRNLALGKAANFSMWQSLHYKLAAQMLVANMGYWYYDMGPDWFNDSKITGNIKNIYDIYKNELKSNNRIKWSPEVAVIIDSESLYWVNLPKKYYMYNIALNNRSQLNMLNNSGVPYDYIFMNDFIAKPEYKKYKVYVFLNLFKLSPQKIKLLNSLKNNGKTFVWLYGAGYLGMNKICPENIKDLSGFNVKYSPQKNCNDLRAIHDSSNILSHKLKPCQGHAGILRTACKLTVKKRSYWDHPRFIIQDKDCTVIAKYISDGTTAIAYKKFNNWNSIYVGSPCGLTSELFNNIATLAGAYTISDAGIEIDMNKDFISIHGTIPGIYKINLPYTADVINLKTNKIEIKNKKFFNMKIKPQTTYWFKLKRIKTGTKTGI